MGFVNLPCMYMDTVTYLMISQSWNFLQFNYILIYISLRELKIHTHQQEVSGNTNQTANWTPKIINLQVWKFTSLKTKKKERKNNNKQTNKQTNSYQQISAHENLNFAQFSAHRKTTGQMHHLPRNKKVWYKLILFNLQIKLARFNGLNDHTQFSSFSMYFLRFWYDCTWHEKHQQKDICYVNLSSYCDCNIIHIE